jgi:HSP20 family protein
MVAEATMQAPAEVQEGQETTGQEQTRSEETYIVPPVDIYEDGQGLVVLADLPGVDKDALEVRVDKDTLTIQARAHHLVPGNPIYREYELTGFYRRFKLSDAVDTQRIVAELKNGVLRLQLPRAEVAQPRRIEVRAS